MAGAGSARRVSGCRAFQHAAPVARRRWLLQGILLQLDVVPIPRCGDVAGRGNAVQPRGVGADESGEQQPEAPAIEQRVVETEDQLPALLSQYVRMHAHRCGRFQIEAVPLLRVQPLFAIRVLGGLGEAGQVAVRDRHPPAGHHELQWA